MRRFVFASHHKLAFGFKDTVDFLTSNLKKTYDLSCYLDEDYRTVEQMILELFSQFDEQDEIIVFTDMFGGSVNQKFLPLLRERPKLHVIAGASLPVVLTVVMSSEDVKLDSKWINMTIEEGRNQTVYLNEFTLDDDDDDE